MYIKTLKIKNLRCFKETTIDLLYPGAAAEDLEYGANVNLLLGDNGTGKTTILRALALSVLAPVSSGSGILIDHMVRGGADSARIGVDVILHPQDYRNEWKGKDKGSKQKSARSYAVIERQFDLEILRFGRTAATGEANLFRTQSPAFFLAGYGATRRVEDIGRFSQPASEKGRSERYQRVASLFENQVPLVPLYRLFAKLADSESRHAQVVELLGELLPNEIKFRGKPKGDYRGSFEFSLRRQIVPYVALADGYRAFIGWVCDLLYQMTLTCPPAKKLKEMRGLAMIDEIDLHLHPRWQRTVVERVSRALPALQFILTSHSPIVAATLRPSNLFVMEIDDDGTSTVKQYKENIFGLSADQTLESPYFGLPTTRAPEFVKEVNKLTAQAKPMDSNTAVKMMNLISGGRRAQPSPRLFSKSARKTAKAK